MKNRSLKLILSGSTMFMSVFLISCDKNHLDDVKDETANNPASISSLKAAPVDLPGRHLAANCFQCHGTNGYAGELKIAGMGSSEIVSKFNSFKAKDPKANIMNVHAKAYTDAEIKLIADFFSKQ